MSPANLAGAPGAFGGLHAVRARASSKMRVPFGALRNAGSKKGSLFGPCVAQEAKKGLFRALRNAGSKKGSLSGLCVAQEAKKGLFSGPA